MRVYGLLCLVCLSFVPFTVTAQGQNPEKDADLVFVAVCNGAKPSNAVGSAMVWFRNSSGVVDAGVGMDFDCSDEDRTDVVTAAFNRAGYTMAYWTINVTATGTGDPKTCESNGTDLPARITCAATDKRTAHVSISGGESHGGN